MPWKNSQCTDLHHNAAELAKPRVLVRMLREVALPDVRSLEMNKAIEDVCLAIESGDKADRDVARKNVRRVGHRDTKFACVADAAAYASLVQDADDPVIVARIATDHVALHVSRIAQDREDFVRAEKNYELANLVYDLARARIASIAIQESFSC
jgi:hypothetical protein